MFNVNVVATQGQLAKQDSSYRSVCHSYEYRASSSVQSFVDKFTALITFFKIDKNSVNQNTW